MEGDILVFSQFLIHKSGLNQGNKARFSLQVRISDLDCEYFIKNNYEIRNESEKDKDVSIFNKKYFNKF